MRPRDAEVFLEFLLLYSMGFKIVNHAQSDSQVRIPQTMNAAVALPVSKPSLLRLPRERACVPILTELYKMGS